MISLKKRFKYWLYGRCPGFAGRFPYFGTQVRFRPNSFVFRIACEQGIYEPASLYLLQSALRPNTHCFDLGSNIGLLSAPLLASEPTLRMVSVEPSPETYQCLRRTAQDSPWADRWETVAVAIGDAPGEIEFFCAGAGLDAFDGTRDTHRAGATVKIRVPVVTVDQLWIERGRPAVSTIKIDVEGSEAAALRGAFACLRATRALVLVEWNWDNLSAHDCPPDSLLTLAAEIGYGVYSAPQLARMESAPQLRAQMKFGENFVLLPLPAKP